MHANPSTAQPCAHDEQEHRLEEFRELLATASQEQLFKVRTLIHALAYHDIEPLENLISQSTNPEELALLTPLLETPRGEIALARFQPIFTKQQIATIDETSQKQRDAHRRIALSVLCMTEKHLQHSLQHSPDAFESLFESAESFLEDSQGQLEIANAAYSRLLLVGSDTKGAQS